MLNVRDLAAEFGTPPAKSQPGVRLVSRAPGYLVHWTTGLPVETALLFGAIISATDPISVLAIFKDLRMAQAALTDCRG